VITHDLTFVASHTAQLFKVNTSGLQLVLFIELLHSPHSLDTANINLEKTVLRQLIAWQVFDLHVDFSRDIIVVAPVLLFDSLFVSSLLKFHLVVLGCGHVRSVLLVLTHIDLV